MQLKKRDLSKLKGVQTSAQATPAISDKQKPAEFAGVPDEYLRTVSMRKYYQRNSPHPDTVDTAELLRLVQTTNPGDGAPIFAAYRSRIRSPLTAIRSKCVECVGGSAKRANECENITCSVWAFRFGKNAFRRPKED